MSVERALSTDTYLFIIPKGKLLLSPWTFFKLVANSKDILSMERASKELNNKPIYASVQLGFLVFIMGLHDVTWGCGSWSGSWFLKISKSINLKISKYINLKISKSQNLKISKSQNRKIWIWIEIKLISTKLKLNFKNLYQNPKIQNLKCWDL